MFRRSAPVTDPAIPNESDEQHDVCLKCGKPTPLGVSLCENDNPGGIKAPSTWQVHGTIAIGMLVGFGLLLLLFRVGVNSVGPFHSSIAGYTTNPDGSIAVAVTVENAGKKEVGAACRISDNAVQDYTGYAFFTDPIPVGGTMTFTQTLQQPSDQPPMSAADLIVKCT